MSALPVHHVTFSLLRIRRSPSFDIWRRVVWYKYEDVSGNIATSVVQLAKQAATLTALVSSMSFESADFAATTDDTGSMFPYNVVTRRHIPQDIYLNLHAEHCLYTHITDHLPKTEVSSTRNRPTGSEYFQVDILYETLTFTGGLYLKISINPALRKCVHNKMSTWLCGIIVLLRCPG